MPIADPRKPRDPAARPLESAALYQLKEDHENYPFREHMIRRTFSWPRISAAFACKTNFKADDWESWFQKVRSVIIEESPSTVLLNCKRLSYEEELYRNCIRPGFAVLWSQLIPSQRSEISQSFEYILNSASNVPLHILKSLLTLCEFMSKDLSVSINLDFGQLAEIGVRCNLLAKALYFKEQEFLLQPQAAIAKLIDIYTKIGLNEAAEGLVEFAKSVLKMPIENLWLESLGRWNKGLSEYRKENSNKPTENYFEG